MSKGFEDAKMLSKMTVLLLSVLFVVPLGTIGASDTGPETAGLPDGIGPTGVSSRGGGNVTVSGSILDDSSNAPPMAFVLALNSTNWALVNYSITFDGNYSIGVVMNENYFLYMFPFSGQTLNGYNLHGFFPIGRYVNIGAVDLVSNFTITPAFELVLNGTDANHNIVYSENFTNTRWSTRLDERSAMAVWADVDDGTGKKLPSVLIPLAEARDLYFQWGVPGYGNVVVRLDNNGTGYQGNVQGGRMVDVNADLAYSEQARMQSIFADYYQRGYDISSTTSGHSGNASVACELALSASGTTKLDYFNRCIAESIYAIESIELDKAQMDIEQNRKGEVLLTVTDLNGLPIEGADVTYNQSSHDFLFGVFDTLKEAGLERFQQCRDIGVNYATAGFYWIISEPTEGNIDYNTLNATWGITELTDMGFTVHVHALIYLLDLVTPDYLKTKSFADLNKTIYWHVFHLVDVYKDRVNIWNVVNEANGVGASMGLTRPQVTELIRTGVKAIKDADPDGRVLVNNPNDWFGQSGSIGYIIEDYDNFTLSISDYIDLLELEGIDIDIIGQQMYNGGYSSFFEKAGIGPGMPVATFDLGFESHVFDQLSLYNKSIAMSELSVSSYWNDTWKDAGYWHGKWNESLQAEFLRQFYTIAFSKEKMESLTWWDLDDNTSFLDGGALFDKDMKPKQAFYALRDLIASWTTNGNGTTNATGEMTYKGFAGDYNITVSWSGHTVTKQVHMSERKSIQVPFVIDEVLMPDLAVHQWELMLRTDDFSKNGKVYLSGIVWNEGERSAINTTVMVRNGNMTSGPIIFEKHVPVIEKDMFVDFNIEWDATDLYGNQTLYLLVDPQDNVTETNESNNMLTITVPLPKPDWGFLKASIVDDSTGLPIAGAALQVLFQNGTVYAQASTDAGGNYTFSKVKAGCYKVLAEIVDYIPANGTGCVSSLNTTTVKVRLKPITWGGLTGTVFDNITMVGINGVTVTIVELNMTTSTNLGGGFGFFGVQIGTYNITVSKGDYIGATKQATILANETVSLNFYILKDVGVLQGTVKDSETGKVIANATLLIGSLIGQISDVNGFYVFVDVPVGTYSMYVSAEGYNDRSVSMFINAQQTTWVNVTLDPIHIQPDLNGTISGVVRNAKNATPVVRAQMEILELGRMILTDDSGRYKFENVPPGNYTIVVVAYKYDTQSKKIALIPQGNQTTDFDLVPKKDKTDDSSRMLAIVLAIVAVMAIVLVAVAVLWKRGKKASRAKAEDAEEKGSAEEE